MVYAPVLRSWTHFNSFSDFAKKQPRHFSFPLFSLDSPKIQAYLCEYNLRQLKENADHILVRGQVEVIQDPKQTKFSPWQKVKQIALRLLNFLIESLQYLLCIQEMHLHKKSREIPADLMLANQRGEKGELVDLISLDELPEANRIVLGHYALNLEDTLNRILSKDCENGVPHPIENRSMTGEEIQQLCEILAISDKDQLIACWKPKKPTLITLALVLERLFQQFCFPGADRLHPSLANHYQLDSFNNSWASFVLHRIQELNQSLEPARFQQNYREALQSIARKRRLTHFLSILPIGLEHSQATLKEKLGIRERLLDIDYDERFTYSDLVCTLRHHTSTRLQDS